MTDHGGAGRRGWQLSAWVSQGPWPLALSQCQVLKWLPCLSSPWGDGGQPQPPGSPSLQQPQPPGSELSGSWPFLEHHSLCLTPVFMLCLLPVGPSSLCTTQFPSCPVYSSPPVLPDQRPPPPQSLPLAHPLRFSLPGLGFHLTFSHPNSVSFSGAWDRAWPVYLLVGEPRPWPCSWCWRGQTNPSFPPQVCLLPRRD